MIHLVTFADNRMTRAQEECVNWAMKWGVYGNIFKYTPDHIDNSFYSKNYDILKQEKGAGYWLWKPYFINAALHSCKPGDILVYMDAGCHFTADVRNIISAMDEDMFFFSNGFRQVEWCKGDVLEMIHGPAWASNPRIVEAKQVQASVIYFKCNENTGRFVSEWLQVCQFKKMIDDTPSNETNYPTFAEHRHDQAVLTSLQIREGYKLHWWPTQYSEHIRGGYENDRYPVMFNHHRKRNTDYA
jgi:hypothetical protein